MDGWGETKRRGRYLPVPEQTRSSTCPGSAGPSLGTADFRWPPRGLQGLLRVSALCLGPPAGQHLPPKTPAQRLPLLPKAGDGLGAVPLGREHPALLAGTA